MLFEAGSMPAGPPIETKKALLLLDFQNDFVSPGGNLHVANVEPFLADLTSLVAEFRSEGEVIWVGTEYIQSRTTISPTTGSSCILLHQFLRDNDPAQQSGEFYDDPSHTRSPREDPLSPSSNPDLVHDREAFLAPVLSSTKYRCCIPGSRGADYPDLLKASMDAHQDLVILKSHYSAFADTGLLMHLRTHLITQVYICGSLSNISVYATVLDAVCHGLQVTIIEDCLGYNDELCHVEAVRQMADNMGVDGVDCQELRDDLAGLLGDVIREEDFTTKFQVSLPPPARTRSHRSKQQIQDWIASLEGEDALSPTPEADGSLSKPTKLVGIGGRTSRTLSESSRRSENPPSLEHSPLPERSINDTAPLEEDRASKIALYPAPRRNSTRTEPLKQMQTKPSTRKRRPSHESSTGFHTPTNPPMLHTRSADSSSAPREASSECEHAHVHDATSETTLDPPYSVPKKKKKKLTPNLLGPEDKIGQGDSRLWLNILDNPTAESAFHSCRKEIKWQKMFHRSGEVPRLVAVQGLGSEEGAEVPIYRHPADESPELSNFDPTVEMLRKTAEKVVGHTLNHVLIQWYRNGEDNISEHSDKTLDIIRGSSIVNLSLGAQRTMTLRTKRPTVTSEVESREMDIARCSQRIPLSHNSLFVLGQETNQHWLHAIRADKRPVKEKEPAEIAFDGERISLTFRHIGTFVNLVDGTIWGQGATEKDRAKAKKILSGDDAATQGDTMIRAFGQENHRSTDWDWDEWYGKGFDVVNFETKPAQESGQRESEGRV